jgi:hypothetical protein
LAVASVICRVFLFDDQAEAERALGLLARAGFLEEHRGKEAIGGTLPYWSLTRKGAGQADVSIERARPLREQAIWQHLATLHFCTGGQGRRYRLEPEDVAEFFGEVPHVNTIHAADERSVYRLYVTSSKPDAAAKLARKHVEEAEKREGFRIAVARGELRFAILVETEEEERKLAKRLARENLPAVFVERIPGPLTTSRG